MVREGINLNKQNKLIPYLQYVVVFHHGHPSHGFLQAPGITQITQSSQSEESTDSCSDNITNIDFDASETGSIYSSSSKELTSEDELSLEGISVDEINGYSSISYFLNSYQTDDSVFSPSQLEDLKKRELEIIERKEQGYYRCRIAHADLYNEIKTIYQKYITKEMLEMLNHPYDTQKNESMNASVAAYAPKNKTYGFTDSINARVAIAAAVQIVGYVVLWTKIFQAFGLTLDHNLKTSLARRDKRKHRTRELLKTKEGKSKRSQQRYEKFDSAKHDFLDKMKTGRAYGSGIALRHATKLAKQDVTYEKRNPPGTLPSMVKCRYNHPNYCIQLGHRDSRSNNCYAYGMTAAARAKIVAAIVSDTAAKKSESDINHGTYSLVLIPPGMT